MSEHSLEALIRLITERAAGRERFIIALAGPPGAGKSTSSHLLQQGLGEAGILQADGYHFDNQLLDQLGLRARKGAPETFDIEGLESILQRIRAGQEVIAPVFDRDLDLVRGSAVPLSGDLPFVIVEGNYLAMNSGPWARLRPLFDLTVFIDVPEEELRRRLRQRWSDLGCSEAEIYQHVEENDLPNARLVITGSSRHDFALRQ